VVDLHEMVKFREAPTLVVQESLKCLPIYRGFYRGTSGWDLNEAGTIAPDKVRGKIIETF